MPVVAVPISNNKDFCRQRTGRKLFVERGIGSGQAGWFIKDIEYPYEQCCVIRLLPVGHTVYKTLASDRCINIQTKMFKTMPAKTRLFNIEL